MFCRSRGINLISASLEDVLEFLHHQYENGLSYSGINTARSALSTVIFLPDASSFGDHPLVFSASLKPFLSPGLLCHVTRKYGMFLLF